MLRILLFSIPFILYGLLVVAVDPFNYFGTRNLISTDLKEDISLKINYAMWKMLRYRRDPVPNLLLGDSRMMSLDARLVSETSGRPYANMAYGGGSLREAIDTFWFATEHCRLETVFFGLNINTFNAGNTKDRVSEVLAALDNPLLYFTNNNVLIAGQKLIRAAITGRKPAIGVPNMDREAFWDYQLNQITKVYLSHYRYPQAYLEELREISEYCRAQGIDLNFLLFPNHVDLQRKVDEFDLTGESARMRDDLGRLGRVLDFAFDNPMTSTRENYLDPYHFNAETMARIVDAVWREQTPSVKVFGAPTTDIR